MTPSPKKNNHTNKQKWQQQQQNNLKDKHHGGSIIYFNTLPALTQQKCFEFLRDQHLNIPERDVKHT
jgi:hypothetical protein